MNKRDLDRRVAKKLYRYASGRPENKFDLEPEHIRKAYLKDARKFIDEITPLLNASFPTPAAKPSLSEILERTRSTE